MSDCRLAEACQICGALDGERLYEQSFASFSSEGLLNGYQVVACQGCGYLFADGLPSPAHFARYYREMSKYEFPENAGKQTPFDLARFEVVLRCVRPYLPAKDQPIGDLGCATGGLLHALKEEGYTNLKGADPSPGCIAAMARLYGIPGVVGSFDDSLFPEQSFDFLFLVGVLEHLREPGPVLARLACLLRPGGHFYIEVPNALEFSAHEDAPFQHFSTEHIAYFTPVSLMNMARKAGLAPITVTKEDQRYSSAAILPAVMGVFQRTSSPAPIEPDREGPRKVREYVEISRLQEEAIIAKLADLAADGEPVVVWGVGTHTQHLLEKAGLDRLNIIAFIDNNTRYHGKEMRGLPIVSPDFLAGRTERVVVSSRVFQREIVTQLQREHPDTEIVTLYHLS